MDIIRRLPPARVSVLAEGQRKGFTMNLVGSTAMVSTLPQIRVEPVQERSTRRVSALIDAACQAIHELGYEQLTTALVAEHSGASIGTVYRYFPDRIAVLQAVANRNLERVTTALHSNLQEKSPRTVAEALTVVLETVTKFFREEKGFRSLRVGDVLDIRPASGRHGNAVIASVVGDYLHTTHTVVVDRAGRVAVETAVDVMDALLGRAFLHSEEGDDTILAEATRVTQGVVYPFSE
jgi:AcrR family transcriptional regulator